MWKWPVPGKNRQRLPEITFHQNFKNEPGKITDVLKVVVLLGEEVT